VRLSYDRISGLYYDPLSGQSDPCEDLIATATAETDRLTGYQPAFFDRKGPRPSAENIKLGVGWQDEPSGSQAQVVAAGEAEGAAAQEAEQRALEASIPGHVAVPETPLELADRMSPHVKSSEESEQEMERRQAEYAPQN
jgi:hypothetical protein